MFSDFLPKIYNEDIKSCDYRLMKCIEFKVSCDSFLEKSQDDLPEGQLQKGVHLSISTASPPLGDYVQVRDSVVLVEEMVLKMKSSHKNC